MKRYLIRWRTAVLIALTHKIALPMLKIMRRPVISSCSKEQLAAYPPGSLGNDLYLFLHKRNLPFLIHYARHDLKHVLLEYDTTDEGEACLQSFMLGNGRVSFPVLATVTYAFITMPEYWYKMKAAYRQGRQSISFHRWHWNELLMEETTRLRAQIFSKNK
jgi:ubiquinone biosynthesis protein Coq4